MKSPKLLSDDQLEQLVGAAAFKRALPYVRSGAVEITDTTEAHIDAIVSGTDDYDVHLVLGGRAQDSTCSCPAFDRGMFCKHLVATAIAARNAANGSEALPDDPAVAAEAAPRPAAKPEPDLRQFLATQSAERLAGWLADLAESDRTIERRLRVYQSQSDPRQLRKALGRLLRAPRFSDWRQSRQFARELDPIINVLTNVAAADAGSGTDLFDYALAQLLTIYEHFDDSGGDVGDCIRDVADRYLKLLKTRNGVGIQGAKALLELQRVDQWGFLPTKAVWPLLDEAGRNAYSAAVEAEYHALPPRKPGDEGIVGRWISEFGPVDRMEALAEACGDVDRLISVIARNLSSGHAYERIAGICEQAGRHREAMQWAERGLKAHPDWRGMRALVARHYERAGLADEALALHWEDFRRQPDADTWRRLKVAADRQWPQYRSRALEHVASRERQMPDGRRDASQRAQLLVADGDIDAAIQLGEQQALSPPVLNYLAARAADFHPRAAAAFLRRAVDATLPRAVARDYPAMTRWIAQVLRLTPDAGTRQWIDGIQATYRGRRKFIALLNDAITDKPQ